MSDKNHRVLSVRKGRVQCTPDVEATLDHCRFCAHSVAFTVRGRQVRSPARAYCTFSRSTEDVDLATVEAVTCDDATGEGYRSIMNIIS